MISEPFFYVLPLLVPAFTAVFVLLLDLFLPGEKKGLATGIAVLGLLITAISCARLWTEDALFLFHEAIRMDRFSIFFTLLAAGLTGLTILNVYPLAAEKKVPAGELLFFLLSCCVGMSLMAWATDLITLFMSLEIMSLTVYILTGIQRERVTATEGAFKYFLLGAFSTGFLLYGIAFIYASAGSTTFSDIANFLVTSRYTIPTIFYIGAALLLVGFAFKIASVPFHMWVPDVYEAAHPAVTGLMATGIKAAAFGAFIRFFLVTLFSIKPEWNMVVWALSVATMTVGNLAALMQRNIKRMLAYSSIAHAGYILVAVAAAKSQIFNLGISAILFYLIAYGLMTMGAFSVIVYASQQEEKNQIDDYAGYGFSHPYLGLAMTLFMLSLTGIPLTAGFIGKFYVFSAALKSHLFILALIAIANSIIAAFYYLRIIMIFYMRKGEAGPIRRSPSLIAVLGLTSAGTVLLGIFPAWWLKIIQDSITALF